jgi:hypothetical protein
MKRPADAYWYDLKDRARIRGGNKCEYCGLRKIRDLHHRTYVREGQERMEDVMAVCAVCHRVIHGLFGGREITVKEGSLADLGDTGFDRFVTSKFWKKYLKRSSQ